MTAEPLSLFDDRAHPPFPGTPDSVQLAARLTDPDTSVTAAQSITPGRTEARILEAFRSSDGGLTDDELTAIEPLRRMYEPTVRTARSRLAKAGLLRDSGERRDSLQGRPMIVWELVP